MNLTKFFQKTFSQNTSGSLLLISGSVLEVFRSVFPAKVFLDYQKIIRVIGKRTKGHIGKCLKTQTITIYFVENI